MTTRTVLTVAALTLQEAARRRVLRALAVLTVVLLALSAWGFSRIDAEFGGLTSGEARLVGSTVLNLVMFGLSLIAALGTAFLAGPVLAGEADGAALLVVGHGPRATELRHRSVSWYCLRHATCPVLVIPPTMATLRALTPPTAEVPPLSPRLSGRSRPQPHGQPAAHGIPVA